MSQKKKVRAIAALSSLAALNISTASAATTPYDLIRPTWPLSWDETAISKFDASNSAKIDVLNIAKTPENYKAGALMPDTLDQAYIDAINTKISPIRVNQVGYLKSDKHREFYFIASKATDFEVVDIEGKSLNPKVTGTFNQSRNPTASSWTIIAGTNAATNDKERYKVEITGPTGTIFVGEIPQTVPTEKRLRIKVGNEISSTFIVSDDVYTMAKDAALKFFGIQRSGYSESWFHGPSHTKDGAGKIVLGKDAVEGYTPQEGALQGGWYDGGDHLKESQTQAFAFMALAVMSATNPAKDVDHYAYNHADFVNTDNIPDVLREAKHGADFFLRAYKFAKGVIDDMPVSIGNYNNDHKWWGRPEIQDYLTVTGYGGSADRDVRLGELGSNISGEIAAGLAILSKDYAKYDQEFADNCLTVAEKMYDFAKALAQGKDSYDGGKPFKNNKTAAGWGTSNYTGNNEYYDDLALASVALLYATGKKEYADDMIRAKDLYAKQAFAEGAGPFAGGWFATPEKGMIKNAKNTSWANAHSYALYALYKLILSDKTKATMEYGLTEEERLAAIEDVLACMVYNLGDLSIENKQTITLSKGDINYKQNSVSYDLDWNTMKTDQKWIYNGYQMGNIFEVLAYADVAADIEKQGITLPKMSSTEIHSSEMFQLGINQLNYMFGVNPWDISFVYGIGDKNDAHPFHRAANPEGRNTPGSIYKYVAPVGGLVGWIPPSDQNSMTPPHLSWENYNASEATLNSSTLLLSALTLVSNGGSDYYEKKCDNCRSGEASPLSGEIYAMASHYTFNDMDMFNIQISNESMEDIDSVIAYIYFDATEEDIESCGVVFDEDICQVYDIAGFNKPCSNDREIMNFLRSHKPQKVEDTYNKDKKTYTWAQTINLGTIGLGNRIRFDLSVSSGLSNNGTCETTRTPSKVKITDGWSFTAHTATKDAPDYAGTPDWDKDQTEIQEPPKDPYIVIRSKGKLLWGYGPSKTTDDRVGIVNIAKINKARMILNDNRLHVFATAQGAKTLKIFDMLGNQLMEHAFDGLRTEVSLAKLPHRGTLVAKVLQNNKQLASQSFRVK